MKTRGRKHSPGEKSLMAQVAEVFTKKKEELGAKRAAKALGIKLPSFYNYAAGTDLPRMEVLMRAHKKWGVRWRHIDPSEFLRTRKVQSAEQLAFSFLEAVREQDVEVVKVGLEGKSILRVALKIRFSA